MTMTRSLFTFEVQRELATKAGHATVRFAVFADTTDIAVHLPHLNWIWGMWVCSEYSK